MGNHYPPVRNGLSPTTTAFGRALREMREDSRLSQTQVANLAGMDHSFLSRLEAGNRKPSRDAVLTIARVMHLSGSDTDALLIAAGYLPDNPASLLADEPVVERLHELLVHGDVPESVKALVRSQVSLIVEQMAAMTATEGRAA